MELTKETQKELEKSEEIKSMQKVEAALFLSARFLSIRELVELTDINPLMLKELLDKLKFIYSSKESAIEILNKEDLWKMDIKQEHFNMINRLATGNAEFTKAEQETLAIIAYKQPVKQSVIIKIRGNKAYDHIKHLIEVGLLNGKKTGHTIELALSENFYDYFHVEEKKNEANDISNNKESESLIQEEIKEDKES
jgi:segregation and condensation protein B